MSGPSETATPIVMRGITKRFGPVLALDAVDFTLPRHEVHILAGENGAGKTTLMNVLVGLYGADQGEIEIDGQVVSIHSPRDAIRHGIGMVHQHFELVGTLSALDNVMLGHEGGGWLVNRATARREVEQMMERFGINVDLEVPVRELSIGVQQKIEILKALYQGARVLILDEPTTHLTPQEVDALFGSIRQLLEGGLTVVLITHKLREIRGIGDRVTVMRRGRIVGSARQSEVSEAELVEMLMGERGASSVSSPAPATPQKGGLCLELIGVTSHRPDRRAALERCTLTLEGGEIVGIAGVAGNGQRELAECIAGTRSAHVGTVRLNGTDVTSASPKDRIRAGLAYIPEDSIGEGILPRLSLSDTMMLGPHQLTSGSRWLFDNSRARSVTREAIGTYGVVAPHESVPTARLSGGNIQKVLIARAMLMSGQVPRCALLAMNPTRGLDIRTTRSVHEQLLDLRQRGHGVLLVSEDLDELLQLSDRVHVMFRGQLVGEFNREQFDAYRIGALMTSGLPAASAEGGTPGN